jgi:hypothetical protein
MSAGRGVRLTVDLLQLLEKKHFFFFGHHTRHPSSLSLHLARHFPPRPRFVARP